MEEQELMRRLFKANWLATEKKYKEAEKLYKGLIPLVEESHGLSDRSTLTTKFNSANTLRSLQKYEEVE